MFQLHTPDVIHFLRFLDRDTEVFTYSYLDAAGDGVVPGCGVLFGIRDEIVEDLERRAASEGPSVTLHVTLNRTKLTGRKCADIDSCRVLCVDLDVHTGPDEIRDIVDVYAADFVVRTSRSPDKYHLYWRVREMELEKWSAFQLGLAWKLGGDKNLRQINKTIRVPGVERLQKNGVGYVPEVVYSRWSVEELAAGIIPLDEGGVLERFPWMPGAIEEGQKAVEDERRLLTKVSQRVEQLLGGAAGAGLCGREVGEIVAEMQKPGAPGRNDALYTVVKNFIIGVGLGEPVSEEMALEVGAEFNAALESHPAGPLKPEEFRKTVLSAYKRACEIRDDRVAKQAAIVSQFEADRVATVARVNEGNELGGEPFRYDYSTPWLSVNRFTSQAVLERVLQRFRSHIVRTGKLIYAFDTAERVWRSQKNSRELLSGYVGRVLQDVLTDDQFIAELCTDNRGVFVKEKLQKAQERFSSAYTVSSTITTLVESDAVLRRNIADFDRDDLKLYCGNGVLDLRTLELRDARAEDYLLHQTSVRWEPGAGCPRWQRFLLEVFAQNGVPEDMVSFMQEVFGYSLTGSIDAQYIFVHWGGACNGKSLVLYALRALVGDYCTMLSAPTLARSKNAIAREFERIGAKIEGKRVCVIDDLETETQWNEGLVKSLTGDTIPVRKLYEEERDIPNRAKFHIGCNEVPTPQSENRGILRRLCIIPYYRTFAQDPEKEREIRAMIAEEMPGILRWAVDGLVRLQKRKFKLQKPLDVAGVIESYTEENFQIEGVIRGMFWTPAEDGFDHAPEEEVHIQQLVNEVNAILAAQGVFKEVDTRSFGRIMSSIIGANPIRKRTGEGRERFYIVRRKTKAKVDGMLFVE